MGFYRLIEKGAHALFGPDIGAGGPLLVDWVVSIAAAIGLGVGGAVFAATLHTWWVGRTSARVLALVPIDVMFRPEGTGGWLELKLQAESALWVRPGRRQATSWDEAGSGDPELDACVDVSGPPVRLRALLDVQTRALLVELVREKGEVDGAWVRVPVRRPTPATLSAAVDRLREVSARLSAFDGPTAVERLTAIAQDDPVPMVRRFAFEALTEPPAPDLERVAAALLADVSAMVQAVAAPHAGEAGRAALAVLRGDSAATVRRLALLGTARGPGALALLAAHVGDGPMVVEALARVGGPDAERELIGWLDREPDGACEALARVASSRAVGALAGSRARSRAAAIQAILAREGTTASPGALSLVAASGGGEVSLVSAVAGRIALSPEVPPAPGFATGHRRVERA